MDNDLSLIATFIDNERKVKNFYFLCWLINVLFRTSTLQTDVDVDYIVVHA